MCSTCRARASPRRRCCAGAIACGSLDRHVPLGSGRPRGAVVADGADAPIRPGRSAAGAPISPDGGPGAMTAVAAPVRDPDSRTAIDDLVARARVALVGFAAADQALVDDAVRALAGALPARARARAGRARGRRHRARQRRGQGHQEPAQDLRHAARSFAGEVGRRDRGGPARGIVKYAKPVGVVGAITPSTNPRRRRPTRR